MIWQVIALAVYGIVFVYGLGVAVKAYHDLNKANKDLAELVERLKKLGEDL